MSLLYQYSIYQRTFYYIPTLRKGVRSAIWYIPNSRGYDHRLAQRQHPVRLSAGKGSGSYVRHSYCLKSDK